MEVVAALAQADRCLALQCLSLLLLNWSGQCWGGQRGLYGVWRRLWTGSTSLGAY